MSIDIDDGHSCNALLRAGTKKRFIYSKSSASTSLLVQMVRCAMRSRRGSRGGLWKQPMRMPVKSTGITKTRPEAGIS